VNYSAWDTTLEPLAPGRFAVRLGLRQVEGMAAHRARQLVAARDAPYTDLQGLQDRARLDGATMRRLAAADAFRSMALDRSDALDRLANDPMAVPLARADALRRPVPDGGQRHPRDLRLIPKSRDFH